MLTKRWHYENRRGLSQWYGHVDYYGPYVVGQWFALNAENGEPLWTSSFHRPNTIVGYDDHILIASECRADGPWTLTFGIYAIAAKSGKLLWTSHGRGFWGTFLRMLDYIPLFTNDIRDLATRVEDGKVFTERKRVLDLHTGRDLEGQDTKTYNSHDPRGPAEEFYDEQKLVVEGDIIAVNGRAEDFSITGMDSNGAVKWSFRAEDYGAHVDSNFYSYRLVGNRVFVILGTTSKPKHSDFKLVVLDLATGQSEQHALEDAINRKSCRIEAIRDARILISCDGTYLAEYEIS